MEICNQGLVPFGFRNGLREREFPSGMDPLSANAEVGTARHTTPHIGQNQMLIGFNRNDLIFLQFLRSH